MPDPAKIANVWLRLSWLYQDVHDEEMFLKASAQALEYFKEAYYKTRRNNSPKQDQRFCYIMGELCLRNHEFEEALKHFYSSIVQKGGSSLINQQARDQIQNINNLRSNTEVDSSITLPIS
jgi:uncharacterized protein (DUF2225 family)